MRQDKARAVQAKHASRIQALPGSARSALPSLLAAGPKKSLAPEASTSRTTLGPKVRMAAYAPARLACCLAGAAWSGI